MHRDNQAAAPALAVEFCQAPGSPEEVKQGGGCGVGSGDAGEELIQAPEDQLGKGPAKEAGGSSSSPAVQSSRAGNQTCGLHPQQAATAAPMSSENGDASKVHT